MGEDRVAARAPVDVRALAEREVALEHFQEEPLVPMVVIGGQARGNIASAARRGEIGWSLSLHVGDVSRGSMIGDVVARMKRMRGFNVLHPFGCSRTTRTRPHLRQLSYWYRAVLPRDQLPVSGVWHFAAANETPAVESQGAAACADCPFLCAARDSALVRRVRARTESVPSRQLSRLATWDARCVPHKPGFSSIAENVCADSGCPRLHTRRIPERPVLTKTLGRHCGEWLFIALAVPKSTAPGKGSMLLACLECHLRIEGGCRPFGILAGRRPHMPLSAPNGRSCGPVSSRPVLRTSRPGACSTHEHLFRAGALRHANDWTLEVHRNAARKGPHNNPVRSASHGSIASASRSEKGSWRRYAPADGTMYLVRPSVLGSPASPAPAWPTRPLASTSTRLMSLDVFRGATIAAMILVNSQSPPDAYRAFVHATWHGLTFADTIFPAFLFIVGVSLALSTAARVERGEDQGRLVAHAVRRSALLFVSGVVIDVLQFPSRAFPFFAFGDHLQLTGVLQKIAVCYLVAFLVYLRGGLRGVITAIVALNLVYLAFLFFYPVPGCGPGVLTTACNFPGTSTASCSMASGGTIRPGRTLTASAPSFPRSRRCCSACWPHRSCGASQDRGSGRALARRGNRADGRRRSARHVDPGQQAALDDILRCADGGPGRGWPCSLDLGRRRQACWTMVQAARDPGLNSVAAYLISRPTTNVIEVHIGGMSLYTHPPGVVSPPTASLLFAMAALLAVYCLIWLMHRAGWHLRF